MAKYFVFLKDKNLKPENIKKGVKIFKTEGTYEGGGGTCDREEWPDLLQVLNDSGGVHAGVVFDTGFPVADGIVNNHFEGYFALGQSMEYMEEHSCFLFGNSSAVDPEIGGAYYWGIWQAYGNINVAFGSRSDYAVFPLGEDGEEGTVSPYDLPVTWDRMENVDPEATGFETDYVYEVKIGNLVKYAPAHDENMEFFDGLNVCVFGRNVEGDPSVYGGKADSGTYSAWLYLESMDEDEISHELDLQPYKLNDSVMFYEAYTIDGETEYNGPIEPILDTHGTVLNVTFDVDMGGEITVTPDDTKQHIATIASNTIMPYVTVNPVILVSESETITENGQVVIHASDYEADGISEITLDVSVGGGGGSDWVLAVRTGNKNTITANDVIGNPTANSYAALFKATGLLSVECNTMTEISAANGCTEMFKDCSVLTTASIPNLTSITGDFGAEQMFRNCTSLTDLDLSGLTSINATAGARYLADGCSALTNVDLSNLNTIGKEAACMGMFSNCTSLESVDLSGLTTVQGWVYSQCNSMFQNCTSLKYVDLRNLSTVGGRYDTFNATFSGCTSLEEIRLDSLTSVSANRTFNGTFNGCTSLTTVTIHPYSLAYNTTEYNPLISAVYIENLYLTANTTTNVRLDWQPNLTAASVLNVLTHLSSNPEQGAQVRFYTSGLTVTDDAQGSIQTAYNAAVAAGWTINNLTIVQP